MPYNKSFIDQASSVKMAGYWPRSLFAFLWTYYQSGKIENTLIVLWIILKPTFLKKLLVHF